MGEGDMLLCSMCEHSFLKAKRTTTFLKHFNFNDNFALNLKTYINICLNKMNNLKHHCCDGETISGFFGPSLIKSLLSGILFSSNSNLVTFHSPSFCAHKCSLPVNRKPKFTTISIYNEVYIDTFAE